MHPTSPLPNGKRPLALSQGWFITVISCLSVGLLVSVTPGAAIPFVAAGLVYLCVLRAQSRLTHHAWLGAVQHTSWMESEARRLGVMDHVHRRQEITQLDAAIFDRQGHLQKLDDDITAMQARCDALAHDSLVLKDSHDVQDVGLYDFENPADASVELGQSLKDLQVRIRDAVKTDRAASATTDWQVNGSAAQGQKMTRDMQKLLLRAYNAEAENAVKTVRAGHLTKAVQRLEKSAAAVAKLGTMMSIRITPYYADLRRRELEITHQHLEAVKSAKEEEKEERRREREERQAQKEFLAAKAKQEKEVEHYRSVLEALVESGDPDDVDRARATLAEAEEKLDDVESTMSNTRAGYVYVASNRGAFGPDVVKIGMTRRLNPEDRLKELSDASVPFNFDSHAMIFSRDAVGLERTLHESFADARVNLVNMRREYFYTTPAQVKEALSHHDVQVLEFHEVAESPEFEASEQLRSTRRAS